MKPFLDPATAPFAALDLDIEAVGERLAVPAGARGALVLLRIAGRPCGQAVVRPGRDGSISRDELLAAAGSSFWEAWLEHRLGLDDPRPAPAPARTVSVAICTRDRTEDLERCLAALLAMPDDGQEILVVDNAPATEATRLLVEPQPRVRYVREPRPGLDVARNRALAEATGEIVAFTDDDAAPDRLWLRHLVRHFDDPAVAAAGGLTMALELESPAQVAFQRYGGFGRGFRLVTYEGARQDPLMAWHAGAGVNMALRRELVRSLNGFDEALDAGTGTQAGGDSDMFRRILGAGYRIVYDPAALNWHRHRRTEQELVRQLEGYETAGAAILSKAVFHEGNLDALLHGLRWLGREGKSMLRSLLSRPGAAPPGLSWRRFRGGLVGPARYRKARAKP
jgi:GT2 family glycosyltransferase